MGLPLRFSVYMKMNRVEKFDVRNSVFVMEQIYRTYLDIPGSPMADPSGAKRDTYAVKG